MERYWDFFVNNWYLFAALVAVLIYWAATEVMRARRGIKGLTPARATLLFNREDAVFVDVRGETEFQKAHLPEAVNVPQTGLEERGKVLEKYKGRPVIVYCNSGTNSGRAGAQLRKMGVDPVFQLKGGINAWQSDNLPVEND